MCHAGPCHWAHALLRDLVPPRLQVPLHLHKLAVKSFITRMARTDAAAPGPRLHPVRARAIAVALLCLLSGLTYLTARPVRQVYWAGGLSWLLVPVAACSASLESLQCMHGRGPCCQKLTWSGLAGPCRASKEVQFDLHVTVRQCESSHRNASYVEAEQQEPVLEADDAGDAAEGLDPADESSTLQHEQQAGEQGGAHAAANLDIHEDGSPLTAGGSAGQASGVPRLTKDLVQQHASEAGIIIVTWANLHFTDFVLNWVHHLDSIGVTAYLVGAMDAETAHVGLCCCCRALGIELASRPVLACPDLQLLLERSVHVFAMFEESATDTGLGTADFGWGTQKFHQMLSWSTVHRFGIAGGIAAVQLSTTPVSCVQGREKINLIHSFTELGFNVLISDVDTVWLRNPIPYMQQARDNFQLHGEEPPTCGVLCGLAVPRG